MKCAVQRLVDNVPGSCCVRVLQTMWEGHKKKNNKPTFETSMSLSHLVQETITRSSTIKGVDAEVHTKKWGLLRRGGLGPETKESKYSFKNPIPFLINQKVVMGRLARRKVSRFVLRWFLHLAISGQCHSARAIVFSWRKTTERRDKRTAIRILNRTYEGKPDERHKINCNQMK